MCNSGGDNYDVVECEYGCSAEAAGCNVCNTSECEKRIVPKYLPTICESLSSSGNLTISANTTLDTSNDLACASVVQQTDAPAICVLHYGQITIERNQTYTVKGSRVLALVADRELVIDGIIDVSANSTLSGPGGAYATSGTGQSVAGGGAGYRTAGGSGATATVDGGAGNAGTARANPSSLTMLVAGAHPVSGANGGTPGGGGGGVTLISCRAAVSVPGLIDAGGGGGWPGGTDFQLSTYFYASGGGSGGTVVLQGVQVNVTGEIYANGGGGGGGGESQVIGTPATAGADGTRSTSVALGGNASTGNGAGGAGGTTFPPGDGKRASSGSYGGAGGGAAGFILVYTPQSVTPTLTPTGVSPSIEPPGAVATN